MAGQRITLTSGWETAGEVVMLLLSHDLLHAGAGDRSVCYSDEQKSNSWLRVGGLPGSL